MPISSLGEREQNELLQELQEQQNPEQDVPQPPPSLPPQESESEPQQLELGEAVQRAIAPPKPASSGGDDPAGDAEDKEEENSTSSSREPSSGSGEGYTADCSSDASSDLSGSAQKHPQGQMIMAVGALKIRDNDNNGNAAVDANDNTAGVVKLHHHHRRHQHAAAGSSDSSNASSKQTAAGAHHHDSNKAKHHHHHHHRRRKRKTKRPQQPQDTSDSEVASDMADDDDAPSHPLQWNGVQIVHPMDPRIDISRVGYLHRSPVGAAFADGMDMELNNHTASSSSHEAPSLDNYMQLMEVVRPFFNSHGICRTEAIPEEVAGEAPVAGFGQLPLAMATAQAGDNDTSDSPNSNPSAGHGSSCSTSSFATTSESDRKLPAGARPLHHHLPPKKPTQPHDQQELGVVAPAAAQGQSLAAPEAPQEQHRERIRGKEEQDDQNSDTSSMVVLARVKSKHRQAHDESNCSGSQHEDNASSMTDQGPADDEGIGVDLQAHDGAIQENPVDPPAADMAPVAAAAEHRHPLPPPVKAQPPPQAPAQDDEEAAQGNASSSSSERNLQENVVAGAHHAFNVPHIVTESASNTNTTTSGSGSAGNSGSNQGSSGSGNGSSGSGNGSSGSGNEGKGSSEDVGAKEENNADGNPSSEEATNSDDRNANPHHHGEGAVANKKEPTASARRHARADGGVDHDHHHHHHAMNMEDLSPGPAKNSDEATAERYRKILDKKRKRMNMRREYEEKVQQEMESSESSGAKGLCLRPGRPVTLDKVLSFTKIPRMVIQAGPPFLVVHTNAAYTRLTGIDAHAAVGKPVSAFLSIQSDLSLDVNGASSTPNAGNEASSSAAGGGAPDGLRGLSLTGETLVGQMGVNGGEESTNQAASGSLNQMLNQSHVAAAEAGRARTAQAMQNDADNICLERLVAASGFGKFHLLHVTAQPQNLVGRNVTFVSKTASAGAPVAPVAGHGMRKRGDGSSDTSLTTNFDGPLESIACRISISPIVSDTIDSAVVTDTNQDPHAHKSKRRKHHHEQQPGMLIGHQHRRTFNSKDSTLPRSYQQYVTHYVIQLEPVDTEKDANGKESLSSRSTSVEANILGLTKAELRRQRDAAKAGTTGTSHEETEQLPEDDEEMASETTEATVPVNAVG